MGYKMDLNTSHFSATIIIVLRWRLYEKSRVDRKYCCCFLFLC